MFTAAIAMLACGPTPPALAQALPAAAQPSRDGAAIDSSAPGATLPDMPDPATVQMPELGSAASTQDEGAPDKYYYFHRPETQFAEALADLRECDDFARGVVTRSTPAGTPYGETLYPLAQTAGGVIGNAALSVLGNALLSEDARNVRRTDMRRCMHYKGYQRFGIEKSLWQKFNFEEGYSSIAEADRQRMLAQQAKVASTPGIERKDLGL